MRNIKSFLITLFLCSKVIITFSQGYIPVTTTIKTPHGNVNQVNYINDRTYSYRNAPTETMTFDLKIVLLNDSVLSEDSKINFSEHVHFITVKHGKTKTIIKPSETKEVYRYSSTGRKIAGIPVDTCWLFLVGKGKINSYSQFPYEAYPVIVAIQTASGPIVPLNKKNLLVMMDTNDVKLLRLIDRHKFDKAINLYNNPVMPKATVFGK